jgi:hypothetical protein
MHLLSAAGAGYRRTSGGTEFGGRLAMAEALQVEQQHRIALAAREGRDSVSDPAGQVGGLRDLVPTDHPWVSRCTSGNQRGARNALITLPAWPGSRRPA